MRNLVGLIQRIALLAILVSGLSAAPSLRSLQPLPLAWTKKVDPWVLSSAGRGETEFLIYLNEQADLSKAAQLNSKAEKGAYVYRQLSKVAERTQAPLLAQLSAQRIAYRSYWVSNMIWVRGDLHLVESLAQRPDVSFLYANPQISSALPAASPAGPQSDSPENVEWNISKVGAPQLWAAGYRGQGVVIAGQDTGYSWTHPALIRQYRGYNNGTADHNYNWHDAIHEATGNPCGVNSPEPCDDHGHGTHTMGTMVGDDGAGNQVGMAPATRWIGCRNMKSGVGSPATYAECYQWFIAPTDLNGNNPRPDLAPDVIDNSWGCPASEGCSLTDPNVLKTVVENVRAAGILTAHSAGNNGPSCSTVNTPAAIYAASFTVGNTDSNDNIAYNSSRGPVMLDDSGRLKPDISAPGSYIRSTYLNGSYTNLSGTSMAAPHVAGAVALLISANPLQKGRVDQLESLIKSTAVRRLTSENCGGTANAIPNNTYGWGRLDTWAAFQAERLFISGTTSTKQVVAGGLLTYTLQLTNLSPISPTTQVIVTDVLPAETTFYSATPSATLNAGAAHWLLGTLNAQEQRNVTLTVLVAPTATAVISNSDYSVSGDQVAPIPGRIVTSTVQSSPLSLKKFAPAQIAPGSTLTYTLQVTNTNIAQAQHSLVLSDTLPEPARLITATLPYTIQGSTLSWNFALLPAGASRKVQIVASIPLTASGTIVNQDYGARSAETPFGSGSPVQTTIVPYGLQVTKHAPTSIRPGQPITYTLTVTNTHPFAVAHAVALSDAWPAETGILTATLPFTVSSRTVRWDFATMQPGTSQQVNLAVQTPLTQTLPIVNRDYATTSREVPQPMAGRPVTTTVKTEYWLHLPYIFRFHK